MRGKFRVVYADPPWQYNDSGASTEGSFGKAEDHYPTLSSEKIATIPVTDHVLPNAVLFLWVTEPMRFEAKAVIDGWGVHAQGGHRLGQGRPRARALRECAPRASPDLYPRVLHASARGPDAHDRQRADDQARPPTTFRKNPKSSGRSSTGSTPRGPKLEMFGRREVAGWDCLRQPGRGASVTADPQATTVRNRQLGSDLDGVGPGHLVNRPVTSLRPLPRYLELRRPVVPRAEGSGALRLHAMREPLLVTTSGTILDGHRRWQVAVRQRRSSLPCLEYDLTDGEALAFVVERHRTSSHLNDFCRIVLALPLEGYFKLRNPRMRATDGGTGRSSKLTHGDRTDVRADIARIAGVSAGNVTKVKQLLKSVIPEIQEHLRRREVSIHKAWQWHRMSPKRQRDALWEHVNRRAVRRDDRSRACETHLAGPSHLTGCAGKRRAPLARDTRLVGNRVCGCRHSGNGRRGDPAVLRRAGEQRDR